MTKIKENSLNNFNKLYKYCDTTLKNNKFTIETKLFLSLIKNIDDKIKDGLNDNKNCVVLYENVFNPNILNLLDRLNLYVKPFRIIYRKKRYCEMTILEKISNDNLYLLIIDWKTKYKIILLKKFYDLIIKYNNLKKKDISSKNLNFYESDNSFEEL